LSGRNDFADEKGWVGEKCWAEEKGWSEKKGEGGEGGDKKTPGNEGDSGWEDEKKVTGSPTARIEFKPQLAEHKLFKQEESSDKAESGAGGAEAKAPAVRRGNLFQADITAPNAAASGGPSHADGAPGDGAHAGSTPAAAAAAEGEPWADDAERARGAVREARRKNRKTKKTTEAVRVSDPLFEFWISETITNFYSYFIFFVHFFSSSFFFAGAEGCRRGRASRPSVGVRVRPQVPGFRPPQPPHAVRPLPPELAGRLQRPRALHLRGAPGWKRGKRVRERGGEGEERRVGDSRREEGERRGEESRGQ
jgi:hypothetical protein